MKSPRRLGCIVYDPNGPTTWDGHRPSGIGYSGHWLARHWFWRLYRVTCRGPDSRVNVMICTRCGWRWIALHANAERLECPECGYLEQVPPRQFQETERPA